MRPAWATRLTGLTLCLVATATLPTLSPHADPPASPWISWLDTHGAVRWTADDPGSFSGDPVAVLTGEAWFKPLPDLDVALLGGGTFSLAEARGSVVLIDFWATWCMPCREELPLLQELYDARREAGLSAVAVNVQEPEEIAAPFAAELGLKMPVGIYHEAMRPTLYGGTLPTAVVADRRGRIRGRWDGFQPTYIKEIRSLVGRLLENDEGPTREVAAVLQGAGRLRVLWTRQTPTSIESLAPGGPRPGSPGIVASLGRQVVVYSPDGQTLLRHPAGGSATALRRGVAGDGVRVAAFRPGAREIRVTSLPDGEERTIECEGRVLDAAWFPSAGSVLVSATTTGLCRHDLERPGVGCDETGGSWLSLAVVGSGHRERLVALGPEQRIAWFDHSLVETNGIRAPAGSWRLLPGGAASAGIGAAPSTVEHAVAGSFLAGDGQQLALAEGSQLLLLDLATGAPVFRARWPGVSALTAVDLNDDGADELVVGAGAELTVLTSATP